MKTINPAVGPEPAWSVNSGLPRASQSPGPPEVWDILRDCGAEGLIFHHPGWLKLIEDCYGLVPRHLVTSAPGGAGLLTLFETASPLLGRKLTSQPFNFYGGLIGSSDEAKAALLGQAAHLWRTGRAKYVEIKNTRPLNPELVAEFGLIERSKFVRYVVALDQDFARVEQGLKRRFREKLTRLRRAATAAGVIVEAVAAPGEQELWPFYDLLTEEYRRKHLMLVQPFKLFRAVAGALPANLILVLARRGGRVLGGAVVLRFGGTDFYLWGAYDLKQEELSPLTLVLAEAMRRAGEAGSHSFDLGLTSRSHEGLNFFKSRWGGVCEPLHYYYLARHPAAVPDLEYFNSYRPLRRLIRPVPRRVIQWVSPLVIRWLA